MSRSSAFSGCKNVRYLLHGLNDTCEGAAIPGAGLVATIVSSIDDTLDLLAFWRDPDFCAPQRFPCLALAVAVGHEEERQGMYQPRPNKVT